MRQVCYGRTDGRRRAGVGWHVWCVTLAACLLPHAMAHARPPHHVYVVSDKLTPDEVFANGIPAPGTNDDVVGHVSGKTCAHGDTGFVSTTASEAFAHELVLYLLITRPLAVVYLYGIRADASFYGVDASLSATRYRKIFPRLGDMARQSRHQEEWIAHRGVDSSHVITAYSYRRNATTGAIENGTKLTNPRYVDIDSLGNSGTLVISTPGTDTTRYLTPSFSPASACFACHGGDGQSESQVGGPDRCDTFTVPLDGKPAQVTDPIDGLKRQRYVPWKTMRRTNYYAVTEGPADCDIVPGSPRTDVLLVNCTRFAHADRFSVQTGAGGSRSTWVNMRFDDGNVASLWTRAPASIAVTGTAWTLHDYGYTIAAVFSGNDTRWWSNVTVLPVYPPLPSQNTDICLHGEPGIPYPLGCIPSNATVARLPHVANDRIQSITAAQGQRYQVCQHWDFSGQCAILHGNTDTTRLNSLGLNSQISSIRACNKPMPSTSQAAPDNHGVIGSVYAYVRLPSGQREFFQLRKAVYGAFPSSRQSNADWTYLRDYSEC